MRSPEGKTASAPFGALVAKEFRGVLASRAFWVLMLLLGPLVGYSFSQAIALYGEASRSALQSSALARGLSPLDGILVPTFGAFYVAVTLLFPFAAIRVLGHERESGSVKLLVQLPYRPATLTAAKFAAIMGAWALAFLSALSAVIGWMSLGGHIGPGETLNLILGHFLYGSLVAAIALFASAVTESAATAAIVALAFTVGSWALDLAIADGGGVLAWLSGLSLTQTLQGFEQGLLSASLVAGMMVTIGGLAALTAVWLPPGTALRGKLARSAAVVAATAALLALAPSLRIYKDLSEDRRNSFSREDERALSRLRQALTVTVHLAPEDPRYRDLDRGILTKLRRTVPHASVRLAGSSRGLFGGYAAGEDNTYGEVVYDYGGRSAMSRSTSLEEILPLIYGLAEVVPPEARDDDYKGYPLVADGGAISVWFYAGLPALVAFGWWRSRRRPSIRN